jgi:hypothetical protein
MGVVAFIELAGADRAQVRTAVADLRAHVERVGARGCLEAVEGAVARSRDAGRGSGTPRPSADRPALSRTTSAQRTADAAVTSEP